jgi:two-component system, chemotaxis family, chemotaxis protein CheY
MNDIAGLKVLVADDEKHIRLLLKSVLRAQKADVVAEASTGQEAIDLFRQLKPDFAMLDINMPVKTGVEATVEECLEGGAVGYILKDTPLAEMKQLIIDAIHPEAD